MLRSRVLGGTQVRWPGVPVSQAQHDHLVELRPEPRAGLRFQAKRERALDGALMALAAKLPAAGVGVAVSREFTGPRGIPDLLATTAFKSDLATRGELALPAFTNISETAVLAALPQKTSRTMAWVAERCGLSPRQAQSRLGTLTRAGAILEENGRYRSHPSIRPIGHTYALEAKVSDWGKGLTQALRYLTWADAAAIVLLEPPQDLNRATERCRALGVGLAVGDSWKVRPRLGRPNPGLRLAASESWFRDFLSHSPSAEA